MPNPYDGLNEPTETQGVTDMGKTLFQSKTFWFNAITFLVSAATYLQGSELLAQYPEVVAIFGTIVGIGNIVLRIITKEPITTGSKSE